MKHRFFLLSLISFIAFTSACGSNTDDNSSSELFTTPVPCGSDNGIPKLCRTERVTDYSVNVDNLLRFTQCGKLRTWMSFDPYVEGACGGVNAGKFVSFGPYLTVTPGQIVAKIHLLPGKLMGSWPSNYAPNEAMFAVDIYSTTLGGSLMSRPDPFDYSDFVTHSVQGVHEVKAFSGRPSPLAQGKNLPEGWKVVEITARVPSAITDLEVRVQSIHPHMNVSVLAVEITHIRD